MEKKEKMTETLSVKVSKEMKAALRSLANGERRTVSQYVALMIEKHLADKAEKPGKGRK
jgi:predicted DNA-binding protein